LAGDVDLVGGVDAILPLMWGQNMWAGLETSQETIDVSRLEAS
jgi:hypothetical protein